MVLLLHLACTSGAYTRLYHTEAVAPSLDESAVAALDTEPARRAPSATQGWPAAWTSPALGRFYEIPRGPEAAPMGEPKGSNQSFYLMEHEVTQAQWQELMGTNPAAFPRCGGACPIERVSWDDALVFADRAGRRDAVTYRLPSETEWEWAASGASERRYSGSDQLGDVGWYNANSSFTTHPVCSKARNEFGLCDMSGNVAEWTSDPYTPVYDATASPDVTSVGTLRVMRGGCWLFDEAVARVVTRSVLPPSRRYNIVGFRLARSAP